MFFISLRRGSAKMLRLPRARGQIGRASCRERGEISVGAVLLKKKKKRLGVYALEANQGDKKARRRENERESAGRAAMTRRTDYYMLSESDMRMYDEMNASPWRDD